MDISEDKAVFPACAADFTDDRSFGGVGCAYRAHYKACVRRGDF